MIAIACFVAAMGAASVDDAHVIDLAGPWKFHAGDGAFADVDGVDDQAWPTLTVPGAFADIGQLHYGGIAWIRRTVDAPVELGAQPLAVAFGAISEAYDAYVDGVKVGSSGDIEASSHGPLRERAFRVPDEVRARIERDGRVVVALRIWTEPYNAAAYRVTGALERGWYALGPAEHVVDHAENLHQARVLHHFVPNAVCSVLIALVGLASLALWLIRRQLFEHLWFGLFGVCLGWSQVAWVLRDDGFLEHYSFEHRVARFMLMSGMASFVYFIAVFLRVQRRTWLRAFLLAFVALNALPIIALPTWPLVVTAGRPAWPLFGAVSLFLVVRGVVQRAPDARAMLAGVAFCTTAVVLMFLEAYGVIAPPFKMEDFGSATVLVCALSMAFVMMLRFGRVYRELDRKNVELLRLDQLKDEFMANTSHELRTPLNGIIGLAESLKDGATGPLPEATQQNLGLIAASGRRLATLVNDILDFAKLRHSGIALRTRAVDVRSAVDVVLTLSSPMALKKGVALKNLVPESLPPVLADEDRFQQILHNLVGNALKFTHAGAVEVNARVVDASALGTNAGGGVDGASIEGALAIAVKDTGIGIAADKLDRIFESFEQGDGSIERAYGGTGLGLAVTKKLVELHGGTIEVASQPSAGSTFTVTMPRASVETASASIGATAAPAAAIALAAAATIEHTPSAPRSRTQEIQAVSTPVAGRHTVLVVDDEPVNLQVLENQLRMDGFTVVKAGDGAEALALLDKGLKPDAVVLDVMMPRMSGYEVTRRIRERFTARLPIVLLTAKDREEDVVEGLSTGANDYIVKPFKKGELVARLRTHLTLAKFDEAARRFVPFTFLELLGKQSLVDVGLGEGVQREASVLFADIRGFTTIAEQLGPQRIFVTLNRYLAQMQPAIHKHRGFINQVYGDGIMALFVNATAARDAVEAAAAMHRAVAAFNVEQRRANGPEFRIGIGVNTGPLMLGTFGDAQRMECGVVSDTVNTAARVEGLTKIYGVRALVAETTFARLDDAARGALREVDLVIVKGRHEATRIFEVLTADEPAVASAKRATAPDFARGLAAYRAQRFGDATDAFAACVTACADDQAAAIYLARCKALAASGAPAGFDGITRLETK